MTETEQLDREDIPRMARLVGLHLPRSYEAELVEAYTHVRRLVALLPQPRARSDEPAHIFNPDKCRSTTG